MSIVEELRAKASRDNRDLLDRAADRIEELEYEYKNIYDEGMAWHREAELNALEIMVLRKEIEKIFEEIEKLILRYYNDNWYTVPDLGCDIEMLKKKYTKGGEQG